MAPTDAAKRAKIRDSLEAAYKGKSKEEMEAAVKKLTKAQLTALTTKMKDAYPSSGGRKATYFELLEQVLTGGGETNQGANNPDDEPVQVAVPLTDALATLAALARDGKRATKDYQALYAAFSVAQASALSTGEEKVMRVKLEDPTIIKRSTLQSPQQQPPATTTNSDPSVPELQRQEVMTRLSDKSAQEERARSLLNKLLGGPLGGLSLALVDCDDLALLRQLFSPDCKDYARCPIPSKAFHDVWKQLLALYDEAPAGIGRVTRLPVIRAVRALLNNPALMFDEYSARLPPTVQHRASLEDTYDLLMVGTYVVLGTKQMINKLHATEEQWATRLYYHVSLAMKGSHAIRSAAPLDDIMKNTLYNIPNAEQIAFTRSETLDPEVWGVLDQWKSPAEAEASPTSTFSASATTKFSGQRRSRENPDGRSSSRGKGTSGGAKSKVVRGGGDSKRWTSLRDLKEKDRRVAYVADFTKQHPDWEKEVATEHRLPDKSCTWCGRKGHAWGGCAALRGCSKEAAYY